MAEKLTPICEFGKPAVDFELKGIDGDQYNLKKLKGVRGLLIIFMCNHCPFVKAVAKKMVQTANTLSDYGVNTVAIMPNDTESYPEDSFENMAKFAKEYNLPFPYLIDETQEIAKNYGAVCTPDFFGYNFNLELQYRGRLDGTRMSKKTDTSNELLDAMIQIAHLGKGPEKQTPSIGCSIKWKE